MANYRIVCRNRDAQERITEVGLERSNRLHTVEEIWNWIDKNEHSFFTFENNTRATVAGGTSTAGRHYITTHPDGVTENNLDELDKC